jgi:hypothetical protein
MTSNPPVGHEPSSTTMGSPSPTTLPEDLPPEALEEFLKARELERKKLEWAQWAEHEYMKCKMARVPFERQWYINIAFNAGKQYVSPVDVPSYGFRLTTPKAPPWRVRLVINRIRTVVRTECSKLTTSKPIPVVMPLTNENEDFSAAAVGEQILKTEFANAQFESDYRSWVWWGVVCGTAFLKQYWDPYRPDHDAKEMPEEPTFPDGSVIPDEILLQLPNAERYKTPRPAQGKICRQRITPFHIYVPDLLQEDINDQPYLIQVMSKSPLWVESRYGFKPACDSRASNTILDAATIIAKGSEDHLDAVEVKEIWIKPNGHKDFPEGGVMTVINHKVVQFTQKWPYPFPEYPYYKYNGIPTGGFYSASIIEDLIPLQKELNKKRSQMIEIQNMMGKPKLVYPKGSINPKMISSEPGQSIPYTPGYDKPEVMQGTEVPTSFVQELSQLQLEFDDISGQHEISRGQTSSASLTSGTAIAYLQEQDDAKLNYQVASIENATELIGKHYLHFASHYWKDSRLVRVTGRNNQVEALHWKKNMLKGNTDVSVQTGSALPFSKAARTAIVQEFMQNGFIDPSSGMEMLNFGGLDKLMEDALIDKKQAMRENLKLSEMPEKMLELLLKPAPGPDGAEGVESIDEMTGQPTQFNGDGSPFQPQPPLPVNSFDNHEEHIKWHNHFRKSQEFENLPELNKQAFEMHVQMHQIALMSAMMGMGGNIIQDNSAMGAPMANGELGGGMGAPMGGGEMGAEQESEMAMQEQYAPDFQGQAGATGSQVS